MQLYHICFVTHELDHCCRWMNGSNLCVSSSVACKLCEAFLQFEGVILDTVVIHGLLPSIQFSSMPTAVVSLSFRVSIYLYY